MVDTANKAIVTKATNVQATDKEAMVNTEALMLIMMIAIAVNAVALMQISLPVAVAAEAKVPMPVTVPVVAGAVAASAINMMAAVVGEIAAGAVKK